MSVSVWAIWMLLAGVLVVAELFTGTFYLLMVAIGFFAGGVAALLGSDTTVQLLLAAVVAIATVSLLRGSGVGKRGKISAASNRNVNLDIGQTIVVDAWQTVGPPSNSSQNASANANETEHPIARARVPYRGALWDVELATGHATRALPGEFIIRDIQGSRLIVIPTHTNT